MRRDICLDAFRRTVKWVSSSGIIDLSSACQARMWFSYEDVAEKRSGQAAKAKVAPRVLLL